jgi:hypothetical protein
LGVVLEQRLRGVALAVGRYLDAEAAVEELARCELAQRWEGAVERVDVMAGRRGFVCAGLT